MNKAELLSKEVWELTFRQYLDQCLTADDDLRRSAKEDPESWKYCENMHLMTWAEEIQRKGDRRERIPASVLRDYTARYGEMSANYYFSRQIIEDREARIQTKLDTTADSRKRKAERRQEKERETKEKRQKLDFKLWACRQSIH